MPCVGFLVSTILSPLFTNTILNHPSYQYSTAYPINTQPHVLSMPIHMPYQSQTTCHINAQPCVFLKYKLCFIKFKFNFTKYRLYFIKHNLYFKNRCTEMGMVQKMETFVWSCYIFSLTLHIVRMYVTLYIHNIARNNH